MVSSPRKSDVLNGILVMDQLPFKIIKTLLLQHVWSPATQRKRKLPLLIVEKNACVQTHYLLQMLFQIHSAIIFVLESQGLGENVAAITGGMFMPPHPSVYIICILYVIVMVC